MDFKRIHFEEGKLAHQRNYCVKCDKGCLNVSGHYGKDKVDVGAFFFREDYFTPFVSPDMAIRVAELCGVRHAVIIEMVTGELFKIEAPQENKRAYSSRKYAIRFKGGYVSGINDILLTDDCNEAKVYDTLKDVQTALIQHGTTFEDVAVFKVQQERVFTPIRIRTQ